MPRRALDTLVYSILSHAALRVSVHIDVTARRLCMLLLGVLLYLPDVRRLAKLAARSVLGAPGHHPRTDETRDRARLGQRRLAPRMDPPECFGLYLDYRREDDGEGRNLCLQLGAQIRSPRVAGRVGTPGDDSGCYDSDTAAS